MIAFAFISLPTIAFGGYFLLSILKRQTGTENVTSEQRDADEIREHIATLESQSRQN